MVRPARRPDGRRQPAPNQKLGSHVVGQVRHDPDGLGSDAPPSRDRARRHGSPRAVRVGFGDLGQRGQAAGILFHRHARGARPRPEDRGSDRRGRGRPPARRSPARGKIARHPRDLGRQGSGPEGSSAPAPCAHERPWEAMTRAQRGGELRVSIALIWIRSGERGGAVSGHEAPHRRRCLRREFLARMKGAVALMAWRHARRPCLRPCPSAADQAGGIGAALARDVEGRPVIG